MLHPRTRRRFTTVVIAALALVAATPALAAAGTGPGSHELIRHKDAALDRFEFDEPTDEVDVERVKLNCRGHGSDVDGVACAWRSEATVASWQLWNLQILPSGGARNLVAEVGADVMSYHDTAVTGPAVYLYAVLGLDAEGTIVAQSRVDKVRVQGKDIGHLRLECDAREDAETIGCGWSAPEDAEIRAYELYRSAAGEERTVIATLGADATGYTDTDVEAGVRYRYRLVALDPSGAIEALSRTDSAGWAIERDRDHDGRDHKDHDRSDRDGADRRDKHRDDTDSDDAADDADGEADDTDTTAETTSDEVVTTAVADTPTTRDDADRRSDGDRRERGRGR